MSMRAALPGAALLLLLALPAAARADDVITTAPAAPGGGAAAMSDAQLLRRVELLLERSEAERRRLEGEMLIREQELRAEYAARVQELERRLAAGDAPVGPADAAVPAATERELAELRRQVADYARRLAAAQQSIPGVAEPSYGALREENAKLAGELQRVMLLPPWPGEATVAEPASGGVLNVNQAAREQLLVVPGLTAAGADFIIWYRDRVGLFTGVAELRLVPDATPEAFSQWRRLLRVE